MKILISAIVIVLSILLSACTDKAITSTSGKSHDVTNIKDTKTNNTSLQSPIKAEGTNSQGSQESREKEQSKLQTQPTPTPSQKQKQKQKAPTIKEQKKPQKQKDTIKKEPELTNEKPLEQKKKTPKKSPVENDNSRHQPLVFPEFYAPEKYKHPLRHSKKLNFMIGEDSKGSYLYGEGPIVPGAFEKFIAYVNHYRNQGIDLKRFMLHSPGGVLDEGLKIGEYILQNNWNTDADKYMRCYSTCGFIYAAGSTKYIQAGAEVGFHRPYIPGVADTPEFIDEVYKKYQTYWESVGGNKDLYDKFMSEYGRDEMLILKTNNIDNYIPVEKY
ncbi:ATP-dependent protease ClpP protease subunit [Vibrio crassostreae]|uniref:hypothetical protein n=1 Tax=Vibrio crassostreae TaxID=246167 RepID=UPI0005E42ACC|nr:hypothetical protein [Vibrio crassostreae]TCT61809.1 hypothetical protein EDB44_109162 [Vibrio crassostreae]TCT83059.1 hypothetical protein EDB43_10946 [Vibrio crassostreae]TCU03392.1 hypothetical protein EDB47_11046 [Vibrio crassostreae]TDW08425.1 hypothetical protein EDB45_1116 [Vibrio crassostreae]CAK1692405.1 ATP-dependent protease ClpP protease subunit [Vibrio crassostreae]